MNPKHPEDPEDDSEAMKFMACEFHRLGESSNLILFVLRSSAKGLNLLDPFEV